MGNVLRLQHTSIPMPPDSHDKARAFFGDALGMREVPPPEELSAMDLIWYRAGEDGHEIHLFVDPAMTASSASQHLCLQVDDLSEIRQRLEKHGVAIQDTVEIASRPRFFIRDPFTNQIEIAQINSDYLNPSQA